MSTVPEVTLAPEEKHIQSLWTALQVASKQVEKRGLQFGQAVYEYRAESEVVSGGTTFRGTLEKLGIPHATAYRWIARYEESTGARPPIPASAPKSASNAETENNETTLSSRTRSAEDRDGEDLLRFAKRLDSVTKALLQILDRPQKWFQHAEISIVSNSALSLMEVLDRFNQLPASEAEQDSALPQEVRAGIGSAIDELKADGHVFQTAGEA